MTALQMILRCFKMDASQFLDSLQARGFTLTVEPAGLCVAPASRLTDADRAAIPTLKTALLELLAPKRHHRLTDGVADDDKDAVPVFLDLETRSSVPISVGGRRYAVDPSTEILSAVAGLDGRIVIWTPSRQPPKITWPEGFGAERPIDNYSGTELPPALAEAIAAGRPFVAHNAHGFEAHIWKAKQLPAPTKWVDTLLWARSAGCPGSLDAAALWLLNRRKDQAGKTLVDRYCKPYGAAKNFRDIPENDWQALIRYNLVDVLLLEQLYPVLRRYDQEPELLAVDQQINTRGVRLDRQLARAVLDRAAAEMARLAAEAEIATGGAVKASDLSRKDFLAGWLHSRGVDLKGRTATGKVRLTKGDVDDLLARKGLPGDVRAVLVARRAVARTTVGKLETALECVGADGRLRDQFSYHQAHTGRWTGHGVQLQNLPKPRRGADVAALLAAAGNTEQFRNALSPEMSFADGLSALIRPCFCAAPGHVLLIADFAGIEARGVAWCAGERRFLDLVEQGRDAYLDMASRIYGRPITSKGPERELGKVAVLGCGFGLGAEKFAAICEREGVDLAAAGVTAEQVIEAYRNAYPKIAGYPSTYGRIGGLWKDVENAAKAAINRRAGAAGRCLFALVGNALVVTLPSGRRLYYRNARLELRPTSWGEKRHSIVYDAPEAPHEKRKKGMGGYGQAESTYGGKLVENLVQATCRDLLAAALIRCERAGLPVVLHAHDEVVCEVPIASAAAGLRQLLALMSSPPKWAEGFPIAVEGYLSLRYAKSPLPHSEIVKASNGSIEGDKGEIEKAAAALEKAMLDTAQPLVEPVARRVELKIPPPDDAAEAPIVGGNEEESPIAPANITIPPVHLSAEDSPLPAADCNDVEDDEDEETPKIRPPMKWFGGKGDKKTSWLVSLIPDAWKRRHQRNECHTYVEPFGGMASVLLNKPPTDVEVYNDLDLRVWNLFDVLKNHGEEFRHRLTFTLYHEHEFNRSLAQSEGEGVAAAVALYVRFRQSFGGMGESFSYSKFRSRRGMADVVSGWLSSIEENLPLVIARLQEVQYVFRKDAPFVIAKYDSKRTFFYLDPPYVPGTRVAGGYDHEMTEADHRHLLNVILACKGHVMLSGYSSSLYDTALAGWHRVTKQVKSNAAGGKEKKEKEEVVWMNYQTNHDEA
jgi:DNA polymerase